MSSWRAAPAVRAALEQATRLHPKRNRASDGTIGDVAHQRAGTSDHLPDSRGVVLAFDLTHDPANGCDAHAMVRAAVARRDPRIKYAISQRRIWSAKRAAEGWRTYTGSNPHDKHAHVSVSQQFEDDTRPWWVPESQPVPPTTLKEITVWIVKDPESNRQYLTDGVTKRHIQTAEALRAWKTAGVKEIVLEDNEFDSIRDVTA